MELGTGIDDRVVSRVLSLGFHAASYITNDGLREFYDFDMLIASRNNIRFLNTNTGKEFYLDGQTGDLVVKADLDVRSGTIKTSNASSIQIGEIGKEVNIKGDLKIDGSMTSIESKNLEISDHYIELAKGTNSKKDADDAGIVIRGPDAKLLYDYDDDILSTNYGLSISGDSEILGNQITTGNSTIYGDLTAKTLSISEEADIYGTTFQVRDTNVTVNTDLSVSKNIGVDENAIINKTLTVGGQTYIQNNTGINTPPSSYALDVDGDIRSTTSLYTNKYIYSQNKNLILQANQSSQGLVVRDDDIGINTIPQTTLDVNGDTNLQSNLDVSGITHFFTTVIADNGIDTNTIRSPFTHYPFITFDNNHVGIGESNPSYDVDVSGILRAQERLQASHVQSDNGDLYVGTNSYPDIVKVSSDGFAIGTTLKSNTIEFNYDINAYNDISITGSLTVDGSSTVVGNILSLSYITAEKDFIGDILTSRTGPLNLDAQNDISITSDTSTITLDTSQTHITGNTDICGMLHVSDIDVSTLKGDSLEVTSSLDVYGVTTIHKDTSLYKDLDVSGNTTIDGSLLVHDEATIDKNLTVYDTTTLEKDLYVDEIHPQSRDDISLASGSISVSTSSIRSDVSIGISTDTPQTALDVHGDISVTSSTTVPTVYTSEIIGQPDLSLNNHLSLYDTSDTVAHKPLVAKSGVQTNTLSNYTKDLSLSVGSYSPGITLSQTDGSVGLHTSFPQYDMDICGSTRITENIDVDNDTYVHNELFVDRITTDTSSILHIGNETYIVSDFFGLQTSNPLYPLDVSGNAHINGSLYTDTIESDTTSIVIKSPTTYENDITCEASVSISDDLHVFTNAYIDNNLGVGTTKPLYAIDTPDDIRAESSIHVPKISPLQKTLTISAEETHTPGDISASGYIRSDTEIQTPIITTNNGDDLTLETKNKQQILTLDDTNGFVGIQTTQPSTTLDVSGIITAPQAIIPDISVNQELSVYGTPIVFSGSSSARDNTLVVGETVGISAEPNTTYELYVGGNTAIHDSIFVSDITTEGSSITMQTKTGSHPVTIYDTTTDISGDLHVYQDATVDNTIDTSEVITNTITTQESSTIHGTLDVSGTHRDFSDTIIDKSLTVKGISQLYDDVDISGSVVCQDTLDVSGFHHDFSDVQIDKTLTVDGSATIHDTLFVDTIQENTQGDDITFQNNSLRVGKTDVSISTPVTILETTDIENDLNVSSSVDVSNIVSSSDISINGYITFEQSSNSIHSHEKLYQEKRLYVSDIEGYNSQLRFIASDASYGQIVLDNTTENVGIHTNNPVYPLDVSGDISSTTTMRAQTLEITTIENTTNDIDIDTNRVTVLGDISCNKTCDVSGYFHVYDDAKIDGSLTVPKIVTDTVSLNELDIIDLSLNGTLDVSGLHRDFSDAIIEKTLTTKGNTTLESQLDVSSHTHMYSTVTADGKATFNDALDVSGQVLVFDSATLFSDLDVSGASSLYKTLDVFDTTTLHDTLSVSNSTTLHDTLDVSLNTTLYSKLFVDTIRSQSDISLSLQSNAITIETSQCDTYVSTQFHDTVNITGDTVLYGRLDVSDVVSIFDSTTLFDTLLVRGVSTYESDIICESSLDVSNTLVVYNDIQTDTIDPQGTSSLISLNSSTLLVDITHIDNYIDTTIHGALDVSNNTYLQSDVDISGGLSVYNDVWIENDTTLNTNATIHGLLYVDTINGDSDTSVSIQNESLTVEASKTNINTVLDVSGYADFYNGLQSHSPITAETIQSSSDMSLNGFITLQQSPQKTLSHKALYQQQRLYLSTIEGNQTDISLYASGASAPQFVIDKDTQNIGVHTSTPLYVLDVAGDISTTGTLHTSQIDSSDDLTIQPNIIAKDNVSFESLLDVSDTIHGYSNMILDGALNGPSATLTKIQSDDISINGPLDVIGYHHDFSDTKIDKTLTVAGDTVLEGSLDVSNHTWLFDSLTVENTTQLNSATSIDSTLLITGAATLEDRIDVSKNAHIYKNLTVDTSAHIKDTLEVQNATTLNSTLDVGGNVSMSSNGTVGSDFTVNGTTYSQDISCNGKLTASKDPFVIDPKPYDSSDGTILIKSDVYIEGTLNTVNKEELNISDSVINIAVGADTKTEADQAGINIEGADVSLLYDVDNNNMNLEQNGDNIGLGLNREADADYILDVKGKTRVTQNVSTNPNQFQIGDDGYYLGTKNTSGSWRIRRSSDNSDLIFEKFDGSNYIQKQIIQG